MVDIEASFHQRQPYILKNFYMQVELPLKKDSEIFVKGTTVQEGGL